MNTLEIQDWAGLKPWLPASETDPITEDFLKSLGFGHDEDGGLNADTKSFIDSCVAGLTEFHANRKSVYALKVNMEPRSYPDVQKHCGKIGNNDHFYGLLYDVQERLTRDLRDSDILSDYGKRFDRFSCYWSSKRRGNKKDYWELNWESASQDNSRLYLLSDWQAGYWETDCSGLRSCQSVFGYFGNNEYGYETPWAAFVAQYLNLLGIAMWSWWVPHCINPETVLESWRYNLGQHIGHVIEDIDYDFCTQVLLERLEILREPDQPRTWPTKQYMEHLAKGGIFARASLGWTEPGEFAMESNANTELVPAFVVAMKALHADTVDRIAESLRRERDVIVAVTDKGGLEILKDNGRTRDAVNIRDFMLARIQAHTAKAMGVQAPGIQEHSMLNDHVLVLLAMVMNSAARTQSSHAAVSEIIRLVNAYQKTKKGIPL
jgi:hypothetical protein